ncbi:MAG: DUF2807 domain-containing protein [Caulobacter sp.]|nr:DUF2807 domain-containing protein [Caulobacter sp.]
MRAGLILGVAGAALLTAAAAQAKEPSVEIRDAVARVVVIAEARDDVKVEVLTTNRALPLTVRTEGDRTIIDGDLGSLVGGDRIGECFTTGGEASIAVRGVGRVDWDEMPQVAIRVPMDARIGAGGAVFGSVGRTNSLDLANAGCGDWTVANVAGALKISQAGSGDTRAGSAGSATIRIAGSGDVATAAVAGGLSANIAGSGDVEVAAVAGDIDVKIAGSGDVLVRGGRADKVAISIAGSGDVLFDGVAGSLNAKVAGSGDIRVAQVTGVVSKSVAGSGDVVVGPINAGE